ncbi:MFS transporter [Pendulispora brunnea]|uniref:MFS transporter n=1 Tax=Pendulispora brunnea TaxID=2905690 RepID=A0ABZ2KKU2_9BACT
MARPWRTVALLATLNVVCFVDRQVIFVLFEPLKRDLGLNDASLGLLGGLGFSLVFAVAALPLGRLADVWNRKLLITLGLVAWSGMTAVSGLAQSFRQLFVMRMGVGIGEASLGPAALSIISDLFPPNRRGMAQSIFAAGMPIGAGLGLFIGAFVAARFGWRAALVTLGVLGLVLALLVLRLREPPKAADAALPTVAASGSGAALRRVFGIRPLRYLVLGMAFHALGSSGFAAWFPSLLLRYYGLNLRMAGLLTGITFATAGLIGAPLGGYLSDRLASKRADGRMLLLTLALLLCAPLALSTIFLPSTALTMACYWILVLISAMSYGPATTAVHDCVPPNDRGTAMAIHMAWLNVFGYALGPLAIGILSDRLHGLRGAMCLSPAAVLVGAALLHLGSRSIVPAGVSAAQSPTY